MVAGAVRGGLACVVALLVVLGGAVGSAIAATPAVPRFSHVVEVMLENESATSTFEDPAAAPQLAALRRQGVYLPSFYAAGHASLSNYEAAFAAVEPTPQGKSDCLGQPYGTCIFPASVPTLGALLDDAGLPWKVYSEGMAGAPGGHDCLHAPDRSAPDPYQGPGTNGYATRHNPAPWFASVVDRDGSEAYCRAHSVDLSRFWADAASPGTLPAWSFVEPDSCHDGHDQDEMGGCALDPEGPGAPSGVEAIDAWLPPFVHRLTTSPGWDAGSLLVITFDEGAATDTSGCAQCHDTSAGGRIGALLIGPTLARPGSVDAAWQGDHYSLLRTWEGSWGLPTLKSRAASPQAAAAVHDGDAGVEPLTGVWATAPPALPACSVPPLRIALGTGARKRAIVRALVYLGRQRVASARGHNLRSVMLPHPPLRSFGLRIVVERRGGTRSLLRLRYHLASGASGCPVLRPGP